MPLDWATPKSIPKETRRVPVTTETDSSNSKSEGLPDAPKPLLVPRFAGPVGHEIPRLYTPEQTTLTPETSRGFDCIDFLENVCGWQLFPWQKWLYIHALELNPDGTYRFDTLVILIARQNGKTLWLRGLALWRLYRDGASLVVNTAQNLDYAEGFLAEADQDITSIRKLDFEKLRYYETNGKHRIKFTQGRQWRAVAATRRGGRSLSADLALMDELREHQTYEAWNALAPTTTAITNSMVVAVSNAGDSTSVVLRNLRDKAKAKVETFSTNDSKVFLAEWSVPDDVDHTDPTYWPMANPSLGWSYPISKLHGYLETTTENGFKTEHLCIWVDVLEPGVFDWDKWDAAKDPNSYLDPQAEHHFCVDVHWKRQVSHIAVAGWRDDERIHNAVVASRPKTDWVIPWLVERMEDPEHPFNGRVVMQARGAPVSSMIDAAREAGLDVVEWGGPELANSAGQYHDFLENGVIAHLDQPVLNESAKAVRARVSGDSWYLDRKNSPADASPIIACSGATWSLGKPVEEADESAYETAEFVVL